MRAKAFFAAHGIEDIQRVLTDNGSCYRSAVFNKPWATPSTSTPGPTGPQTNGKVERFNRTLAREWAYRQAWKSNEERSATLTGFLHRYNYHRPHTALRGHSPIARTTVVTNLCGYNS